MARTFSRNASFSDISGEDVEKTKLPTWPCCVSPFCEHRSTACTLRGWGSFVAVELTPADTSLASSAIYVDFSLDGLLVVVADAAVCPVKGHVAAWLVLVPAVSHLAGHPCTAQNASRSSCQSQVLNAGMADRIRQSARHLLRLLSERLSYVELSASETSRSCAECLIANAANTSRFRNLSHSALRIAKHLLQSDAGTKAQRFCNFSYPNLSCQWYRSLSVSPVACIPKSQKTIRHHVHMSPCACTCFLVPGPNA